MAIDSERKSYVFDNSTRRSRNPAIVSQEVTRTVSIGQVHFMMVTPRQFRQFRQITERRPSDAARNLVRLYSPLGGQVVANGHSVKTAIRQTCPRGRHGSLYSRPYRRKLNQFKYLLRITCAGSVIGIPRAVADRYRTGQALAREPGKPEIGSNRLVGSCEDLNRRAVR